MQVQWEELECTTPVHYSGMPTREASHLGEALGDGDGEGEALGDGDGEGEALGDGEGDGDAGAGEEPEPSATMGVLAYTPPSYKTASGAIIGQVFWGMLAD